MNLTGRTTHHQDLSARRLPLKELKSRECLSLQVLQVLEILKVLQVLEILKVLQVLWVLQVLEILQVLKGQRILERLRVLKILEVLKVLSDNLFCRLREEGRKIPIPEGTTVVAGDQR